MAGTRHLPLRASDVSSVPFLPRCRDSRRQQREMMARRMPLEAIVPSVSRDELGDDGNGLLRLFFHDPMAGVGHHGSLDITRDELEFRLHRRSKGMVAADREDRQAKLPDLRKQRFVLFGVSRKGGKLAAEGVVNCAGPRIQLGIMASRVLANRRWIR